MEKNQWSQINAAWAKEPIFQRFLIVLRWVLLVSLAVFYSWNALHIGLGAFDGGSDESMRALIPRCILNGNLLPSGYDECATYHLGNWSYAFYPQFIAAYLSAAFMKGAQLLGYSSAAVYMCGRCASIVFGLVTLLCASEIVSVIFKGHANRRLLMCVIIVLMGAWPQFAFLSSYMNNDIAAMCGVALMVYALVSGIKEGWRWRNAIPLSLGIIVAGLGYWNAYGFILVAIVMFLVSVIAQNQASSSPKRAVQLIAVTAGICAIVVLPFFAANLVRYHDLIGMSTFRDRYMQWIDDGGEVLQHPWEKSLNDLFFKSNFVQDTLQSFTGELGYMAVTMPFVKYLMYYAWVFVGFGMFLTALPRYLQSRKFITVALGVAVACAITLGLYLFYNLNTDYQPQGRYIIYLLIPLLIVVVTGIGNAFEFRGVTSKILLVLLLILYVTVSVGFFLETADEQGWVGVIWTGTL